MLNVGILGIGNAGNQVAYLGNVKWGIDFIALNCSEKDLSTIGCDDDHKFILGDARGAGKNRDEAKKSLKGSIQELLSQEKFVKFYEGKDIVFIVSSTGGGTGSGIAPICLEICSQVFPKVLPILIAITPALNEGLSTQLNTLDYLKELYDTLKNPVYMIYDNDKLSKLPSHIMMQSINENIVNDINVIRCHYNMATQYSSIDEKDMMTIVGTKGRIVVSRIEDIVEKDIDNTSIEDMIIERLNNNCHAELQRDSVVNRTGIIVTMSAGMIEKFDTHIPSVQKVIGAPIEEFEHIYVNDDRKYTNNVFLILSGLSSITDRIVKINQRITEIESRQGDDDTNVSELIDEHTGLNDKRQYRSSDTGSEAKTIDLESIFTKF